MAVYYVSAQRGNDNNDGLSQATPFLTIGKAVTVVAAGDSVAIGPGTYREKPVFQTAGTSELRIVWCPDPDCVYLTDDKPGMVRVTGCDENENPTSGAVWHFNAKTYNQIGVPNPDLMTGPWGQIFIDGSSDSNTVTTSYQYCYCVGLVVEGAHGIGSGGIIVNCIAIAALYGISNPHSGRNLIGIAGYTGISSRYSGRLIQQSIAIGGYYGFGYYDTTQAGGKVVNSLAFGAYYGFMENVNVVNSIALSCNTGFYGKAPASFQNCQSVFCRYGAYGTDQANPLDVSGISGYCNNYPVRGSGYETATALSALKHVGYNPLGLISALCPILQFDFMGNEDSDMSGITTDITGGARRLCDGVLGIGPYEPSLVSVDWENFYNVGPGVRIERAGQKLFEIPAAAGERVEIWVRVKHLNTSGDKPQIVLNGESVTPQTDTHGGADDTWQELYVSAIPGKNEVLTLILSARDTGAGAVSYFSDITVS